MKRIKYNMEFIFRASPTILYTFLTTPTGLVRWFCDEVDITKNIFTFFWDGSEEKAKLIEDIEDERVRFTWEDGEEEDEYLEFRMYKSDITNETIFEITEFCDEDEVTDQEDYWNEQVEKLRFECGG